MQPNRTADVAVDSCLGLLWNTIYIIETVTYAVFVTLQKNIMHAENTAETFQTSKIF